MRTHLLLPLLLISAVAAAQNNVGIGTTTPTDPLHTTGTVRHQGYSGLGTRLLYIDSAGRLATAPTGSFFSNNTRDTIPDNGCAVADGASTSIAVTGVGTVPSANIAVRVNIRHTYAGDLYIYLVAPNGAVLNLSAGQGAGGDNFLGTVFSDAAPVSITSVASAAAPFTATYRPEGSTTTYCTTTGTVSTFGAIGGGTIAANGSWTMRVYDGATGDAGALESWQISFAGPAAFGTAAANGVLPLFRNGALTTSNITQSATGATTFAGTAAFSGAATFNGAVKISSGTPAAGEVLTSDAAGNATWAPPASPATNTAFRVFSSTNAAIASSFTGTVLFSPASGGSGSFNDGGNFTAASNAYKVPANGVYQFSAVVGLSGTAVSDGYVDIRLKTSVTANWPSVSFNTLAGEALPGTVAISFIMKLSANELVTVELYNASGGSITPQSNVSTQFSGSRLY